MIRHIADNRSAGCNNTEFANGYPMTDAGARTDPAVFANRNGATQMCAGGNMHTIRNDAIVIDRAAGIENDSAPDAGAGIDNRTGHHNGALADEGMAAYDCTGMDDGCQRISGSQRIVHKHLSYSRITDADDGVRSFFIHCRERGNSAGNWNTIDDRRYRMIIQKEDGLPASHEGGGFCDYPAMTACTQYQ